MVESWHCVSICHSYPDKWHSLRSDVLVGGRPTPLKNDGVKVSWDDDIPNIWKNKKMFQTTNQFRYF